MKSGELVALLGIDKSTLYNWLDVSELQKYLSPGALAQDGASQRTFSETDLQVLNTVRIMKSENRRRPWEEVVERLESGELLVDVPTHGAINDPRTVPLQLAEQSARVMALNEKIEGLQLALADRDKQIQLMRRESAEALERLRQEASEELQRTRQEAAETLERTRQDLMEALQRTRQDAASELQRLRQDAAVEVQRLQTAWERERDNLSTMLHAREGELTRLNEKLLNEVKELNSGDIDTWRQMGRMEAIIDQLREELARLKGEGE
jgi:hypothetical protein